jgi:hypothetical protein
MNGDFACNDGGGAANIPSLSQNTPAPIAPDPTHGPGPVGGPDGTASETSGNLLGGSGIEGGPGCSCHVGRGQAGPGAPGLLLLLGCIAARCLRRRR